MVVVVVFLCVSIGVWLMEVVELTKSRSKRRAGMRFQDYGRYGMKKRKNRFVEDRLYDKGKKWSDVDGRRW